VNPLERIHQRHVASRRVRVLVETIAPLIPERARLLDVGCGDAEITRRLMDQRPDIDARGIDVLVRPDTALPVEAFDGQRIPYEDGAFDTLLLVDVLHHAEDPQALLGEATRVARSHLVIKDHRLDGLLAGPTLRFMDRVGNARYHVDLPHNYWSEARWRQAFEMLGLRVEHWSAQLGLYPFPISLAFDRGLHFAARLGVPDR
jgi:SAM-dependent methyltransferase